MANTNKMTKVQIFAEAIDIIRKAEIAGVKNESIGDIIAGLSHEIDLINAKAAKAKSGDTKAAQKKRAEQQAIFDQIFDVLADGERRTATQIGNAIGVSVQKASALLKIMVDGGECQKAIEKKVSYFFLESAETPSEDTEGAAENTEDAEGAVEEA